MQKASTYYLEKQAELKVLVQEVKGLIGEDEVLEALEHLSEFGFENEEETALIIFRNRWSRYNKNKQKNLLTNNEGDVSQNKIIDDLLSFCNELLSTKLSATPSANSLFFADTFQQEKIIGKKKNLHKIQWLAQALEAAKSVCRIQVNIGARPEYGTGFLTSDGYLFTNHHVLPTPQAASLAVAQFGYVNSMDEVVSYQLDATTWRANAALDFAKVKVKDNTSQPLSNWGGLELQQTASVTNNAPVYIIQHPQGEQQQIALTDNEILRQEGAYLYYKADTLGGSSGSPVFNENWEVVAIHHAGMKQEAANRGILFSAILEELSRPIEPIESAEVATTPEVQKTKQLGEHHKYFCNREKQNSQFKGYINRIEKPHPKLHFFYLHGGEEQEHSGLFQRFVHVFQYKEYQHINTPDVPYRVKPFEIPFPSGSKEYLRIEVLRKLFESFKVKTIIENMQEKTLAFALSETAQSTLSDLNSEDKVCVLFKLSEARWDKDITPKIAEYLIHHFCLRDLPEDAPEFYFFFSVEYDEDNTAIRQEIETALGDAEYTIGLPELKMVQRQDIKEWFFEYQQFWENGKVRKQAMNAAFPEEEEEYYMEDVQIELEKVINNINQKEKDADRNQ